MNRRVLRAVPRVMFAVAAMGLAAYAFGRVTRSEWVWWLAPLTVALDGSLLLRARLSDGATLLSSLEAPLIADLNIPTYLASSVAAAGMAAAGAYTGNRLALITGAALAILGNALDQEDEPACEQHQRAGMISCRNLRRRSFGTPSPLRPTSSTTAGARSRTLEKIACS